MHVLYVKRCDTIQLMICFMQNKKGENMKKVGKFLPLFLVAPLLVGCGSNKKVEKPKFADNGSSIEAEKFMEDLEKAQLSCKYSKEEKVGSFELKSSDRHSKKHTVTRGKNVADKKDTNIWSDATVQYDSSALLMASKGETGYKITSENKTFKEVEKLSFKVDAMAQGGQYSGANYLIAVDKKAKEYTPVELLSDELTLADALDAEAKEGVMGIASGLSDLIEAYILSDEEGKKLYSFYNNDNVFTIEYNKPSEEVEVKDLKDEVYRVDSDSNYVKVQVDFTNDKMAYRFYSEYKSKSVYKKAVDGHALDEVVEEEDLQSAEAIAETKSVKLKAADVSKYTAIGFDLISKE